LVRNLGRGLSYGIGAFPLVREVILLATIAVLTMQPRSSVRRRVAGCALLTIALVLIRHAGVTAAMQGQPSVIVQVVLGLMLALGGWTLLAIRSATVSSPASPSPD
jgi:hypothetical protein